MVGSVNSSSGAVKDVGTSKCKRTNSWYTDTCRKWWIQDSLDEGGGEGYMLIGGGPPGVLGVWKSPKRVGVSGIFLKYTYRLYM